MSTAYLFQTNLLYTQSPVKIDQVLSNHNHLRKLPIKEVDLPKPTQDTHVSVKTGRKNAKRVSVFTEIRRRMKLGNDKVS